MSENADARPAKPPLRQRVRGWPAAGRASAGARWRRSKAWVDRPRNRPWVLLLTVLTALVAIPLLDLIFGLPALAGVEDWISRRPFLGDLFFPTPTPEWKDKLTALIPIVGLPVAFWLWHWRDRNAQEALENTRKDINLKEFQEVALRAAGALDEKLPAKAREQLQIAALHQARAFLRGEYGEAFVRPAFELLLAGHAAAMARIGLREAIDRWRANDMKRDPGTIKQTINQAVRSGRERWNAVDRERAGIIRDEWEHIFGPPALRRNLPLIGKHLGGINLRDRELPKGLKLEGSSFVGANLFWAHLEGADLREAHLEGADLSGAHLEGANLWRAHLEGADLREAHLEGANLSGAHLEGANLSEAHLEGAILWRAHLAGADLSEAHLEGANLWRARLDDNTRLERTVFDDATELGIGWDELGEAEREEARERLRERGAIHVRDLPPE